MKTAKQMPRLKQARIAAGFKRAVDAAESLGVHYQTYAAHENGNRAFDVEQAILYARRYRVSLDWLLTGHGRGPDGAVAEAPIDNDAQILSVLARIEGLTDVDIATAFSVISNARKVNTVLSAPAELRDQPQPASPRHAKAPS